MHGETVKLIDAYLLCFYTCNDLCLLLSFGETYHWGQMDWPVSCIYVEKKNHWPWRRGAVPKRGPLQRSLQY